MSVERPGDPFHFDMIGMAEWCLLPTFQLLDAFTRVLTPAKVPIYNGQYGWYKASANRERMTTREKYVPFHPKFRITAKYRDQV